MIITRAKQAHHGVSHLAYVSGMDGLTDEIVGNGTASPLVQALRGGLVVMGIATFVGASPGTARLAGIIGAGWTLATRK